MTATHSGPSSLSAWASLWWPPQREPLGEETEGVGERWACPAEGDGTAVSCESSTAPVAPGRRGVSTPDDGSCCSARFHLTLALRSTAPWDGSAPTRLPPARGAGTGDGTEVRFERGARASEDGITTTSCERSVVDPVPAVGGVGGTNPDGVGWRRRGSEGTAAPSLLVPLPLPKKARELLGRSGSERGGSRFA